MFRQVLIVILFFVVATSSTCKKEIDRCEGSFKAAVDSVKGPETGSVGIAIPFQAFFTVYNGCGGFDRFEESGSGFTRNIHIIGSTSGCVCTSILAIIAGNYTFNTSQPGVYQLNFWRSDSTFVSRMLTIE